MNLRLYSFASGVNQGNEREVSPKFLCVSPEVWELLHSLFARVVASFSAQGVFEYD